jgi:hypothetical protein
MTTTYLTTEELSERIKYDVRTIRQQLNDSVLLEGKHYIKPFGRRKILYLWEAVEEEMLNGRQISQMDIPMANGAVCHG